VSALGTVVACGGEVTDYIELGKRLVACKHFRWLAGMLISNGARIVTVNEDTPLRFAGFYPDLSDAATKGCLLQLVREAWGCDSVCTCDMEGYDAYEWVCIVDTERLAPGIEFPHTRHGVTWFEGSDESAAMVVAMEAAP
jgi:hypothetical protein